MQLRGDPDGIAALKELHAENKTYMKFLVGEARSNTDRTAIFTSKGGVKFALTVDVASGDLVVHPHPLAPNKGGTTIPPGGVPA